MLNSSGKNIPTANAAIINTIPSTASFQPERFNFFWIRPNTTANTINMIDTIPAEPFVLAAADKTVSPSAFTV